MYFTYFYVIIWFASDWRKVQASWTFFQSCEWSKTMLSCATTDTALSEITRFIFAEWTSAFKVIFTFTIRLTIRIAETFLNCRRIVVQFFKMVLGKLLPTLILTLTLNQTLTLTGRGEIFLGGNCPDTILLSGHPLKCSINIRKLSWMSHNVSFCSFL